MKATESTFLGLEITKTSRELRGGKTVLSSSENVHYVDTNFCAQTLFSFFYSSARSWSDTDQLHNTQQTPRALTSGSKQALSQVISTASLVETSAVILSSCNHTQRGDRTTQGATAPHPCKWSFWLLSCSFRTSAAISQFIVSSILSSFLTLELLRNFHVMLQSTIMALDTVFVLPRFFEFWVLIYLLLL